MMKQIIKKHYPIIISLAVFLILLVVVLFSSLHKTNGHFVYATDDAYIHMSIAKNFALYGVWGVDGNGFTSSTSSPLWTFLISLAFKIVGVKPPIPFALNVLFSVILLLAIYVILKKYSINPVYITITLLLIIFCTPIIPVSFTGQEHIMQLLSVILFVYVSTEMLLSGRYETKNYLLLFVTAAFVTASRYEGVALLVTVAFIFILIRKIIPVLVIALGGALPISVYGIISVLNGWYFFPNPIMLKGKASNFLRGIDVFIENVIQDIMKTPHIFVLVLTALFLLVLQINKSKILLKKSIILLFIFITIAIAHLLFARIGNFYRYEAYLVGLGIFTISIVLQNYTSQNIFFNLSKTTTLKIGALILLVSWLLLPLVTRGIYSLKDTPYATKNIYEQQYQMGLFLKKYYNNATVAANDIGAINFLADINCVDLWGLATLEVLNLKAKHKYTTQKIYEVCKKNGVKLAIVYDKWYKNYGGLPPQWIKVGEWTIQHNVVCGGEKVSFYAVDSTETENLIKNLQEFSKLLPSDVIQSGKYTEKI